MAKFRVLAGDFDPSIAGKIEKPAFSGLILKLMQNPSGRWLGGRWHGYRFDDQVTHFGAVEGNSPEEQRGREVFAQITFDDGKRALIALKQPDYQALKERWIVRSFNAGGSHPHTGDTTEDRHATLGELKQDIADVADTEVAPETSPDIGGTGKTAAKIFSAKRLMFGAGLVVLPLFFLGFIEAAIPKLVIWVIVGLVAVGGIALIRPLHKIRIDTKGRAVALLVGTALAVVGLIGNRMEQEQEAQLAELKQTDQSAYFAKLREMDEPRWQRELEQLDPEQREIELARIAAEEARLAKEQAERKALEEKYEQVRQYNRLCGDTLAQSDAYFEAQRRLRPFIRQPHTADFPWTDYRVDTYQGCVFVVRGYFDAQNAFGASMRTNFTVKLKRSMENPKSWTLEDIALN